MSDLPEYSERPSLSSPDDRLALLYHLSQTFNSSLDLDEVLNSVMDEVIAATGAERGFVMLRDENGALVFRVARGMKQQTVDEPEFHVSLSIIENVAQNGKAVLTSDAQVDPHWNMRQSVRLFGLRSILCVPLQVKERFLGIIYVDNRMQASIFSLPDLDLLNSIAASAGIAIENARLYQLAVEKGRLERELQMARQVQMDLLPRKTPELPGWEFAARWLPARQVAGDYYDFFTSRDSSLGIVVADVSDKGMPAALFMALTRSIIRASLDQNKPAMEGMARANMLIAADSTSGMFVTLFFAIIEAETAQMTYVNAGHNPALYFQYDDQRQQGTLHRLERTGMALGVDPSQTYAQSSLSIHPRDFLVIYTDGVTDAQNPQGQFFGMRSLEETLLRQSDSSARQIATALETELRDFIGDQPLFDDITFVVARRVS